MRHPADVPRKEADRVTLSEKHGPSLTPYKGEAEAAIREESRKDFEKNVKPVVEQLEAWRRDSARATAPLVG